MRLSVLTCFFIWSACTFTRAQKHDNHLIFGADLNAPDNNNGVLLHFDAGYPQFNLANIQRDYYPYCVICSDSAGSLLFHTNGRQILNRHHDIMEGGDTINPGQVWSDFPHYYPSLTGGLAIPAPGLKNHYYIFHTSAGYDPVVFFPILYVTLIDMNANGGDGKVVYKNVPLAQGDIPSPVAIKHGNGRDWWLIAGDMLSQSYQIYRISPSGIDFSHEQVIAPASLTNYGHAKASPDGTVFVSNDDSTGLWIFDFDRCSGFLENPRVLPYSPPEFWTATNAFSPDGRFFYAGTHLVIYQLDMRTIDSSYIAFDTIGYFDFGVNNLPPLSYTRLGLPETMPDEKIHYNVLGNSRYIHVMHSPSLPHFAADLEQQGLELPQINYWTRCYFPNYRTGALNNSPCDTLGFSRGNSVLHPPAHLQEDQTNINTHIRILKLPPDFTIPKIDIIREERHYNPLNIREIFLNALKSANNAVNQQDTGH
jgi:hypothetical protein